MNCWVMDCQTSLRLFWAWLGRWGNGGRSWRSGLRRWSSARTIWSNKGSSWSNAWTSWSNAGRSWSNRGRTYSNWRSMMCLWRMIKSDDERETIFWEVDVLVVIFTYLSVSEELRIPLGVYVVIIVVSVDIFLRLWCHLATGRDTVWHE